MNEKALDAAKHAVTQKFGIYQPDARTIVPAGPIHAVVETAIEAYLAALPDDDGLVKGLRYDAKALRTPAHDPTTALARFVMFGDKGEPSVSKENLETADRFDQAADALEAARGRTEHELPKEPPTAVFMAVDAAIHEHWPNSRRMAKGVYEAIRISLAAAPEPPA